MIVLGIETSTARSSVAVLSDGAVAATEHRVDARGHGAFIGPAVRRCLDAVGGAVALDAVAVGTGPGLYTGLRVGMATAAALASARGLPIVGVGGLDVLAHQAREDAEESDGCIVTTLDARRGQVFWQVFGAGRSATDGPLVGSRAQLDEAVAALAAHGPVRIVGEIATETVLRPDAVALVHLALAQLKAVTVSGEPAGRAQLAATFAPAMLSPVYLRDADVRIGWNERGGVRAGGPA
jgi:tRNA threonylcarbamoyladenosine biosynthesis protein TsaB